MLAAFFLKKQHLGAATFILKKLSALIKFDAISIILCIKFGVSTIDISFIMYRKVKYYFFPNTLFFN
jgi:hypothetical protein